MEEVQNEITIQEYPLFLGNRELTHVVQQRQNRVQPTKQGKGLSVNDNPSLENEADNMGKKAANGQEVDVAGKGSEVQKQDDDVNNNSDQNQDTDTLPTTLGLSGSVGKDCTNADADVLIVKNKLIEYGFLESSEATQSHINDAIGEFQKDVLGFKSPDKQISAKGSTDRALTTYYSAIKSKDDFEKIKTNQKDFSIESTKVSESFVSDFTGVKISTTSTAANVNINALISLRIRLNDFGIC